VAGLRPDLLEGLKRSPNLLAVATGRGGNKEKERKGERKREWRIVKEGKEAKGKMRSL